MAQIVKEPGLGERLGTGLGAGLSQGMQALANFKIDQMQQQMKRQQQQAQQSQMAQLFKTMQIPEAVAYLPESLQGIFLKEHLQNPQNQAFMQSLINLFDGGQQTPAAPATATQPTIAEQPSMGQPSASPGQPAPVEPQATGLNALQGAPETAVTPEQIPTEQPTTPAQPDFIKLLKTGGLKPNQATKLAELQLKKQGLTEKTKSDKQKLALSETKALREQVQAARRGAREFLPVLDEMKQLSRSGKLDSPIYLKTLETLGLDNVGALTNPESQQYQKLQNSFLKNLKSIFGGRITQAEMSQYLKSVPTLMNSPEGREKIFKDMEISFKAQQLAANELDKIMEETGDTPPINLDGILEKRLQPKLDKLYEKLSDTFKQDDQQQSAFDSLPSAGDFSGRRIKDSVTGKIYKSNGSKWITEGE